MESRLRIAGHAIHPVLVMFPWGLLATAAIFDAGNLLGGPALLGEVAYWSIGAALVGGLLAGVACLVDLMLIQNGSRARRTAVMNSLLSFAVLLMFLVIFMVRRGSTERAAGAGLFLLELIALAGAVAGAWHRGELLDRLGAWVLHGRTAGHRT